MNYVKVTLPPVPVTYIVCGVVIVCAGDMVAEAHGSVMVTVNVVVVDTDPVVSAPLIVIV